MNQPQYPSYPGPDGPTGSAAGQPPPYGQSHPYAPPAYGQPPVYGHQPQSGHLTPPPARVNTKALWAMILGIVSVVFCYVGLLIAPAAIVLAVLAKKEIRQSFPPQSGDGMATAGLVTGIVAVVIWVAAIGLGVLGTVVG